MVKLLLIIAIIGGGAALVFESGTYYLSQRALRYRIGAEGRQPLTDELLRDAGSAMAMSAATMTSPASVSLTLQLRSPLQQSAGRMTRATTLFMTSRRPQ